jgi:hypothetical protein
VIKEIRVTLEHKAIREILEFKDLRVKEVCRVFKEQLGLRARLVHEEPLVPSVLRELLELRVIPDYLDHKARAASKDCRVRKVILVRLERKVIKATRATVVPRARLGHGENQVQQDSQAQQVKQGLRVFQGQSDLWV